MATRGTSSSCVRQTDHSIQDTASTAGIASIVRVQPTAIASPLNGSSNNDGINASQSVSAREIKASSLSANDYAVFVRDISEQCEWTDKVVHNVLRCMQHYIELYRSNRLVAFFQKIASLTPGTKWRQTSLLAPESNCGMAVFRCYFSRPFRRCPAHSHPIRTAYVISYVNISVWMSDKLCNITAGFGTLDGFENLVLAAPDVNTCMNSSEHETKEQDRTPDTVANNIPTVADTPSEVVIDNTGSLGYSEEAAGAVIDEDEHDREPDGSPAFGSPAQIPQTGAKDVVMDECENEQSPPLGSPAQTPQTGNEDGADDHSSSGAGKQSSPGMMPSAITRSLYAHCRLYAFLTLRLPKRIPGTTWPMPMPILTMTVLKINRSGHLKMPVRKPLGFYLNCQVSYKLKMCVYSCAGSGSDAKDTEHSKGDLSYPLSRQFSGERLEKPPKRGKDDQYGKSFNLAKKRRLGEKSAVLTDDDNADKEEGDAVDEGYDEGDDDDDYHSEEVDEEPVADDGSVSSNGEQEDISHPLQNILDSLESHIAELQEKQRILIKRKEEREWRENQYVNEYGVHLSMRSFASER
ncbi:unnamed protein product [Phytophthora fragariaefolia]|uniref:Unnamed protein product n=1 Tax=Phytophthora fragariaefolia TaxID=1490495 RepID=A0A9W6Y0T2_9STRA|nr:unnamed protein product [Phytophthora fragariaefolia]